MLVIGPVSDVQVTAGGIATQPGPATSVAELSVTSTAFVSRLSETVMALFSLVVVTVLSPVMVRVVPLTLAREASALAGLGTSARATSAPAASARRRTPQRLGTTDLDFAALVTICSPLL